MKSILLITALVFSSTGFTSTFIGNGGQAGDVELAVSLKQLRSAVQNIDSLLHEDRNKSLCTCPDDYNDHALCEIINKLTPEQVKYCDKFIETQLSKLEKAIQVTQFEWVETSMLNQDKVGVRVVDAVAQKDKKKIYIDQARFIDLTPAKRLFLLTHELFHMDKYNGITLDDEDKIGPFHSEYGVRDLLNSAAAGIVMTSIDERVFQKYSKYLNQSRSTKHHWFSLMSPATQVKDDKGTNFKIDMEHGYRFSYLYQPENLHNFGFTIHLQTQEGDNTIFGSVNLKERRSSTGIGVSYRHFLFNSLDPLNQFWNTFVQLEVLYERLDAKFNSSDKYTTLDSVAASTKPVARLSLVVPLTYNFWLNVGADFSQHEIYYSEFKYTLKQNSPTLFLGVTYGL